MLSAKNTPVKIIGIEVWNLRSFVRSEDQPENRIVTRPAAKGKADHKVESMLDMPEARLIVVGSQKRKP